MTPKACNMQHYIIQAINKSSNRRQSGNRGNRGAHIQ